MRIDGAFTVISAEREALADETNRLRTVMLTERLSDEGFPFLPVRGSYKGRPEASFVVPVRGIADLQIVQRLAAEFLQESILYVSEAGRAELLFTSGQTVTYIGTWQPVDLEQAAELDAFTKVGERFYAVI